MRFRARCPWCSKTGFEFGRRPRGAPGKFGLSEVDLVCPYCGGLAKVSAKGRGWLLLWIPVLGKFFYSASQRLPIGTPGDWGLLALAIAGLILFTLTLKWEKVEAS